MFQSPKSGKFESNMEIMFELVLAFILFQSPKSGKFESNELLEPKNAGRNFDWDVSIP